MGQQDEYAKKVEMLERDRRALELIEVGYRTSIIRVETGLPDGRIRDLFHGYYARLGTKLKKPASGSLPEADAVLKTRASNAEGTIFMLLYTNLAGRENAKVRINIDAVTKAHNMLMDNRQHFGLDIHTHPLDINRAWILAREYRSPAEGVPQSVQFRSCLDCGAPYLVVAHQRIQPTCPFCALATTDLANRLGEG